MFPDFLPFEWRWLLYTKCEVGGGYPNGNKGTHHLAPARSNKLGILISTLERLLQSVPGFV
jgi:hypothetical protein